MIRWANTFASLMDPPKQPSLRQLVDAEKRDGRVPAGAEPAPDATPPPQG